MLPDGTEVEITHRAADPSRDRFELEMVVPPHSTATPPHTHPAQTDEFEIVSGTLEVLVGTQWQRLTPGEMLVVPPGVVHTYRNHGDIPAVCRNAHDPAGSFQEYIDRLGLLSRAGKLDRLKSPRAILYLSILWGEHQDAMRMADPRLRAFTMLLARIGRAARVRVPRP